MALSDFSGVIPPDQSTQIISEAILASAALTLGNRVPMGTHIAQMPVPKTFPTAGWTSSSGGRKPYTDLSLQNETMTAEEVAAVVAIPDSMVEDSTINLWNYARPLVAQAIALAVDDAMLFGLNAPATFPVGGVVAHAATATAGVDDIDTINNAMGLVEAKGLAVTGHAADVSVRAALRGVRATTGELVLGYTQAETYQQQTLFGLPIAYSPFAAGVADDYITGAWKYLVIGVRSDIRYDMNPAGVIADAAGKVLVSGWQDNVTPLKVWARFGCVIVDPATPRHPTGANPFAKAPIGPGVAPATASASSSRSGSK